MDAPEAEQTRFEQRTQEREVRWAAQAILASHLNPKNELLFWEKSHIDLSGAVLMNLDFKSCRMGSARFLRTRFFGPTIFHLAEFEGDAYFSGSESHRIGLYTGRVMWYEAETVFDEAKFGGEASFYECNFAGKVSFNKSVFLKGADFGDAVFALEPPRLTSSNRKRVLLYDARVPWDLRQSSRWPPGWVVVRDIDEPTWGYLARGIEATSDSSNAGSYRAQPAGPDPPPE